MSWTPEAPTPPPDPDEVLREGREAAKARNEATGGPTAPEYIQGQVVCSLTLDLTQAWLLSALLHPWHDVKEGDWEMTLAVWDIWRRLTESVAFTEEG
jgi:hypothetical protein